MLNQGSLLEQVKLAARWTSFHDKYKQHILVQAARLSDSVVSRHGSCLKDPACLGTGCFAGLYVDSNACARHVTRARCFAFLHSWMTLQATWRVLLQMCKDCHSTMASLIRVKSFPHSKTCV